jgi:uncharacterized phage infection (PIP) family protein YhgE
MNETAEVLLKKTRNELDEIAVKLGINTAGLAKTKMAESIVEARKKAAAKEIPKAETPKAAPPKFKAPLSVEVAKPKPKISIGKTGVYAKCAAIDAQINENNEAVAVIEVGINELNIGIKGLRSDMDKKAIKMHKDGASMLQQGFEEMTTGIKEKLNGIGVQIKANKKAASNMNASIKVLNNGIKDMRSDLDKKAKKMLKDGASNLQTGVKEMNNGIREMETAIDRKNDEIQKSVRIINVGINGLENKFEDFRTETSNYKHEFYYG